jgi:hypothetical protein
MQVSKSLLAICATTVCAAFLSVHAQDTPAQAAARAALMQSMGQPAAAAPVAPAKEAPILVGPSGVVTQQTNAPALTNEVATPAPVVATPPAAPVVMTPQPFDSEAQAAARSALLQAMGQTEIPVAAPSPAVVAPVAVAPTTTKPAPTTPAAPEAKPVATNPAKASNAIVPGQEPGFPPMVAPALPISAGKEQQLDALLAQYKANLISPEEYQKQRAAILAAP